MGDKTNIGVVTRVEKCLFSGNMGTGIVLDREPSSGRYLFFESTKFFSADKVKENYTRMRRQVAKLSNGNFRAPSTRTASRDISEFLGISQVEFMTKLISPGWEDFLREIDAKAERMERSVPVSLIASTFGI